MKPKRSLFATLKKQWIVFPLLFNLFVFAALSSTLFHLAGFEILRVQFASGANAKEATVSAAWPNTTTNGNLLVAAIAFRGGARVTVTPPTADWRLAGRSDNGNTLSIALYYVPNAPSQAGVSTWALSSNENATLTLLEYSGASLLAPLDQIAVANGKDVLATTGSTGPLADAGSIAIGVLSAAHGDTVFGTPTNGFSEVTLARSTGTAPPTRNTTVVEEKRFTGTDAQAVSASLSGKTDYAGLIAIFRSEPFHTDLNIVKTIDNSSPTEGDAVAFTISVHNGGSHDATNVRVLDQLEEKLTYVSDDSGGTYDASAHLWNVGSLAVGETKVLHIAATVDAAGGGLTLSNTSSIISLTETDDNLANNVSTVTLSVQKKPEPPAKSEGGGTTVFVYPVDYSVLINNGAACVSSRVIEVSVKAAQAKEVLLGYDEFFLNTEWRKLDEQGELRVDWNLLGDEGEQKVYALFKSSTGTQSSVISASTHYDPEGCEEAPNAVQPTEDIPEQEEMMDLTPPPLPEDVETYVGPFTLADSSVADYFAENATFISNLAHDADDFWNGATLTFHTGALAGQSSIVTDYRGADRRMTVFPPFAVAPSFGDQFSLSKSSVTLTVPEVGEAPRTPVVLPEEALSPDLRAVYQKLSEEAARLDEISYLLESQDVVFDQVAGDITQTTKAVRDIVSAVPNMNTDSVVINDILSETEEISHTEDAQDKIFALRSLVSLSRRLIAEDIRVPLVESYMSYGSLDLQFLVYNPLPRPYTVKISSVLPSELRAENVLAAEGLTITPLGNGEMLLAEGEVTLSPNEAALRTVHMEDIWQVSKERIEELKITAVLHYVKLEGTEFSEPAKLYWQNFLEDISKAEKAASLTGLTPQAYINRYRTVNASLEDAEHEIDHLKSLILAHEESRFSVTPAQAVLFSLAHIFVFIVVGQYFWSRKILPAPQRGKYKKTKNSR